MREECRHFESRTYGDGETARICQLDLAPEAPWRCPENCWAYSPRLADAGFARGSLVSPPTPAEPSSFDDVAELLDEAEDIVNDAAPHVMEEVEEDERKQRRRWWPWRRGR